MEPLTSTDIVSGITCILGGLTLTLGGFLFRPASMMLGGFFGGFWIAYAIYMVTNLTLSGQEHLILLGICLGAGILIGGISAFVRFMGTFSLGMISGWCIGLWLLCWVPVNSSLRLNFFRWIFLAGLCLAQALFSITFKKSMLVFNSSLVGSFLLFVGFDHLAQLGFGQLLGDIVQGYKSPELDTAMIVFLAMLGVSCLLGNFFQSRTTRDIPFETKSSYFPTING